MNANPVMSSRNIAREEGGKRVNTAHTRLLCCAEQSDIAARRRLNEYAMGGPTKYTNIRIKAEHCSSNCQKREMFRAVALRGIRRPNRLWRGYKA